MNVPLDRLYNFLDSLICPNVVIYRFDPHGSTKWDDLKRLFKKPSTDCSIAAICHDQDPLDFDSLPPMPNFFKVKTAGTQSPYSKLILVHSQKNLSCSKFHYFQIADVYYWSHAIIARDWYRYAQVDPHIQRCVAPQARPFLIYNRAWSGSREYRLKFLDMLVTQQLVNVCNVKFSQYDNGKHYGLHIYQNQKFRTHTKIENFVEPNNSESSASADYVAADYAAANLEVVLETVFDKHYWHLTEKSLRPIAMGKPFILASTPGSLQYLRSYGFQTFEPWIDESYDNIQDPVERLDSIVREIKRIANLSPHEQEKIYTACQVIADANRERFFGRDFFNHVVNEFNSNMNRAIHTVKQSVIV